MITRKGNEKTNNSLTPTFILLDLMGKLLEKFLDVYSQFLYLSFYGSVPTASSDPQATLRVCGEKNFCEELANGNDTNSYLLFAYEKVPQISMDFPIQILTCCLQGHLENLCPSSKGMRKMIWKNKIKQENHSYYSESCAGHKVNVKATFNKDSRESLKETGPGSTSETLLQPRARPNHQVKPLALTS